MFLYTLINVSAFYGFGQSFMSLIDAQGSSCGGSGEASCSNPGLALFLVFLIPPFALSLYVRRRYAANMGARATGREYFLYLLMGIAFLAGVLANFWRVSATISLLVQSLFWGYCCYLGVPNVTAVKAGPSHQGHPR
jgi:hypothetical protein